MCERLFLSSTSLSCLSYLFLFLINTSSSFITSSYSHYPTSPPLPAPIPTFLLLFFHLLLLLLQGSFRHAQTGNQVSREELMMVLVSLESLQIRALHSQSAHSVSLRGAVLEGAELLPAGRHANNVEICMCPANYLGDSCQVSSDPFDRSTSSV